MKTLKEKIAIDFDYHFNNCNTLANALFCWAPNSMSEPIESTTSKFSSISYFLYKC